MYDTIPYTEFRELLSISETVRSEDMLLNITMRLPLYWKQVITGHSIRGEETVSGILPMKK